MYQSRERDQQPFYAAKLRQQQPGRDRKDWRSVLDSFYLVSKYFFIFLILDATISNYQRSVQLHNT